MEIYRAFSITVDGHIRKPPRIIESPDDEAALALAHTMVDGRGSLEIWCGDRLIGRVPPKF